MIGKLLFHTDNKALVEILNKKSSKSKQVMQLVRPLILVAMLNNIHFKAFHIEGYKNSIADSISRKQWEKFWTLVPEADVNPLTIPEDCIRDEIEHLTLSSIAPNTKMVYSNGLNAFNNFRNQYNLESIWHPPIDQLCTFVVHLSLRNTSHSTVSCYLSAVGFQCKLMDVMDTTQNFLLRKMLEGIKRTKGKKDCRLPITKDLLCKIITTTSAICNTDFEASLFSASFPLAYYAFLELMNLLIATIINRITSFLYMILSLPSFVNQRKWLLS